MPKKVVSWRRESLLSGAGERSVRRRLASLLDQNQIFSMNNIRSTSEERCVGIPGAGESCAPAPGKLFPGAGGSCVPALGKLFPGAGERLAGRWLV